MNRSPRSQIAAPQVAASSGSAPPRPPFADLSSIANDVEASPRILIVEDDFLIFVEMEQALADAGFDVMVANSGEEALEMAREQRPVLAVMDIRLGAGMDGVEAALELFRTLEVRSVFATAHSDEVVRARAAPARPAGWISKPYAMSALVALVRAALAE